MSQPQPGRGPAPGEVDGHQPTEQAPPDPVGSDKPAPPPRPSRSGPVYKPPPEALAPAPAAVRVSFYLWIFSFMAGLAAMAVSTAAFTELRSRIERLIIEQDATLEADRVTRLARATLFGTLGGIVGLIVVLALLAAYMRLRRQWARIGLTVLGVIAVPVMLATAEVAEPVARLALLVAGVFFVPALVPMFTPQANRWFRTRGPV
jgi:hypothetical protein